MGHTVGISLQIGRVERQRHLFPLLPVRVTCLHASKGSQELATQCPCSSVVSSLRIRVSHWLTRWPCGRQYNDRSPTAARSKLTRASCSKSAVLYAFEIRS